MKADDKARLASDARHAADLEMQRIDIERWGSLENKAFWDHFVTCDGTPYVKVGIPRACSCGFVEAQ